MRRGSRGLWEPCQTTFISAGYYQSGDLRHVDNDAIDAWMDNFCRANPLKDIEDGAEQLVREIKK